MNLDILKKISYGMYIISTSSNDKLAGCVVNTVTQITSSNPIVAISINKNNYTNEILKQSKKLAISILSMNAPIDIISRFGYYSSRDINKYENTKYEIINDIPVVIDSICGYLLGDVIDIIDVETHDIFLVRITDTKNMNNEPMTYSYYQTNLKGKSPKNAPTYIEEKMEDNKFNNYRCIICGHIYDESIEKIKFDDLPEDWVCPICGVSKDKFEKIN